MIWQERLVPSPLLGEPWRVFVASGERPRRIVYLLHGRGHRAVDAIRAVGERGTHDCAIAVPDAPWLDRASYYVDSPGLPVASALVQEVLPAVEQSLSLSVRRDQRVIAGYSMGGAGALTNGLGNPELFGGIVALSPAVYVPDPPQDSSARTSGAFAGCGRRFDPARYRTLGYPALLERYPQDLATRLAIAVGDSEPSHPGAAENLSMRAQAEALLRAASVVPGITASMWVHPGGHDVDVWRRALGTALEWLG